MCLTIWAECPASQRNQLKEAARRASSKEVWVVIEAQPRSGHGAERPARATISDSERGGCACGFLAEDADWDAESWSMEPEVLGPLARTLRLLAQHGPRDLVIAAEWAGDRGTEPVSVSPEELGALAARSQIGTRSRYTIRRNTES